MKEAKSEEWVRLTFEKQRGISEAAEFPRSAHDRCTARMARMLVLSAGRQSMCARRHAGRLGRSRARRRRGMPVTLLGAWREPGGDLTTKNNQSRYHENIIDGTTDMRVSPIGLCFL